MNADSMMGKPWDATEILVWDVAILYLIDHIYKNVQNMMFTGNIDYEVRGGRLFRNCNVIGFSQSCISEGNLN